MILFQFLACYCTCYLRYVCQSILQHNYFKPVGNCNKEQQVKLPDPIGTLMKEIPFSVILAASNDIESLMKESSTKMAFYISTRIKTCCDGCFRLHFKPPFSKHKYATLLYTVYSSLITIMLYISTIRIVQCI